MEEDEGVARGEEGVGGEGPVGLGVRGGAAGLRGPGPAGGESEDEGSHDDDENVQVF